MFVYITISLLLDDLPIASRLWGEHGSDTGMKFWLYAVSRRAIFRTTADEK
jgi:hypothetical protein